MKPYTYGRRLIEPRDQYRRWVDPRYRGLRLQDVIAYLQQHGWTEVPSDRPAYLVFQEPPGKNSDDEPFYQIVPDSEKYDSYPQMMFELLTGLAEVENRQASDIINDILTLAAHDLPNGAGKSKVGKPMVGTE